MMKSVAKKAASAIRTCPKCGSKLGQKNLCPICSKPSTEDSKKTRSVAKKVTVVSTQNSDVTEKETRISPELSKLLEPFVKENLHSWNNKFDDFFDSLQKVAKKEVTYIEAVMQCKRWHSIFSEIHSLLGKNRVLSADLMLEIMAKIPQKFPEITDMKARELAREFFQNTPRGDYSMLFMPADGMLLTFPNLKEKYEQGKTVFGYKDEQSGRNCSIAAPFSCYIRLYLQSERKLKKGEVLAVMDRIPDKTRR